MSELVESPHGKKPENTPNPKRPHILWGRAETLQLEKLIGERWPVKKIAARLKKSEKAVRKKCEWLGISSSTTYRRRGRAGQKYGGKTASIESRFFEELLSMKGQEALRPIMEAVMAAIAGQSPRARVEKQTPTPSALSVEIREGREQTCFYENFRPALSCEARGQRHTAIRTTL